jgi:hypothetical protein
MEISAGMVFQAYDTAYTLFLSKANLMPRSLEFTGSADFIVPVVSVIHLESGHNQREAAQSI